MGKIPPFVGKIPRMFPIDLSHGTGVLGIGVEINKIAAAIKVVEAKLP